MASDATQLKYNKHSLTKSLALVEKNENTLITIIVLLSTKNQSKSIDRLTVVCAGKSTKNFLGALN